MKIKKYAAIDIGSNAVRILVTNVVSYKKKTVFWPKPAEEPPSLEEGSYSLPACTGQPPSFQAAQRKGLGRGQRMLGK